MDYAIYVVDVETTGLDAYLNDVIELSMYRLSDDNQKTWCLKPINMTTIDPVSLRINGHKLEDIRHETKIGRDTYLDPQKVITEVENWVMDDGVPAENRVLCGQNVPFDKNMLEQLWKKCKSFDSFPFGRRTMDTMQLEFFLDWCRDSMSEGYSLANLTKKYGIVNTKAHSAEADTKATVSVFRKQIEFFKSVLTK